MGGIFGGGNNDTTTRTEPWAPQAPYLQDSFQQAQNLYRSGGPDFYPGATYVPFSQQTEQGLAAMQQRAMGGSPLTSDAQNFVRSQLNVRPQFGGGMNYLQGGPTLGQYAGFAGAGTDPYGIASQNPTQAPNVAGLAGVGPTMGLGQSMQPFTSQVTGLPGATQQALSQTAGGANLTNNPYLDQTFNRAAQQVTDVFNREISPGIAAQFSLSGRSASPGQADIQTQAAGQLADSLSGLATDIYGGNYQQERDRQLQAAQSLGSLSQGQQGLGLQAAGQGADFFTGQQQQDIARRGLESQNLLGLGSQALTQRGQDIGAAGQAGQQDISRLGLAGNLWGQGQGRALQAGGLDLGAYQSQLGQQTSLAGMANALANQDYTDLDRMLGVGQRVEDLGRQALQDRMNRFNYYQTRPQDQLARYIAALQGNYGGSTQMQGPQSSGLQNALGGGLAGWGIGGPWGAGIGALLGLLG